MKINSGWSVQTHFFKMIQIGDGKASKIVEAVTKFCNDCDLGRSDGASVMFG